ncbi:conserved hypothetical protein [Trichinella spiralis]|nr:conserved hypothetical protein [Trichinella spiralis]
MCIEPTLFLHHGPESTSTVAPSSSTAELISGLVNLVGNSNQMPELAQEAMEVSACCCSCGYFYRLSFACIIQKIYACGILIPPSQLYNRCGILGDDYCLIFKLFTIVVLHLSKVTAISIGQFFRNAPLVETIACLS